jgi:hypothetical protein
MKKTKTHALSLFLMLCWAWLSSCGDKSKEDCAEHIGEKIRKGVSLEVAQSKLKECGFKTSLDPAKKTLYADKLVDAGAPVWRRTQVNIKLDSDNRVKEVVLSGGLIGP